MIDSDHRPDSNRCILLKSALPQITVWIKGNLKSASFPHSQIYDQFIG